jgi:hypothetical protein
MDNEMVSDEYTNQHNQQTNKQPTNQSKSKVNRINQQWKENNGNQNKTAGLYRLCPLWGNLESFRDEGDSSSSVIIAGYCPLLWVAAVLLAAVVEPVVRVVEVAVCAGHPSFASC